MIRRFSRITLLVLAIVFAVRLIAAALLPIIEDEAYYAHWSWAIDFGYFDHPPMVAWLGVTGLLRESSAFYARLGCVLASGAFVPFAAALMRRAGATTRIALLAALALACGNLYALAAGVLLTPDAVLMVAWCAALNEAAAALGGSRTRWVTAGIATGVGLLSKYVMVLIGPVFVIALLWGGANDRKALRTPWPWLGALAAALVFSPHLVWNARNDWVSFRLQLMRGFAESHDVDVEYASPLPRAQAPAKGSYEWAVGAYFSGEEDRATIEKRMERFEKRSDRAAMSEANRQTSDGAKTQATEGNQRDISRMIVGVLTRLVEYAGGLLALWGACVFAVVHALFLLIRRERSAALVDSRVRPLLLASVFVPIAFFGVVSVIARAEANWPAVYLVGAAALMIGYAAAHARIVLACAAVNVVIVLAVSLYASNPPSFGGSNRILEETHGWADLADVAASLDAPVLADAHQTIAQIRFHRPDVVIAQWPGITRPSEFVRRDEWNPFTVDDLGEAGGLYLLIDHPRPPRLPGFHAVRGEAIVDCVGRPLQRVEAMRERVFVHPCADQNVHTWYLLRYEPDDE